MRFLLHALTFVLLSSSLAAAQTTATLVGYAEDATGGRLPGVSILVTSAATGAVRQTVTDGEGRFALAGLPAGDYVVRAEIAGFRPLVRSGVSLTVGENASLALTLAAGATEDVQVSGGAGQVNTRSSELSYLVDQRTIERIPINGRNFTDLMALQPGVTPFPHRDNGSVVAHGLAMSVNGVDPRANVYLLDGTLLNDFTNGPAGSAAGTALGMDTVREFRVETNAYSAEFGRAAGGQINVITKSGTNELAASLFEFHRNDALDARNYFDTDGKPPFTRNQFGGTAGGPVVRDRLFYFVGYEALRENLGRSVVTTVPDDDARLGILPSGTVTVSPAVQPYLDAFPRANGDNLGGGLARYTFPFDQTLRQHFFQARADAAPADGIQAFVRYTLDDTSQRLPTDYPQFPRAFVSRNQFLTAEFRQVLTASTLHTARAGYSRTRIGQDVEANTAQPLPVFVPGRPLVGAIDIGGFPRFGTQASANVQLGQDVYSAQYDLAHARGRHLFKAGALVEHYQDDEFNPTFSLGIFRFANLSAFLRNQPALFIGLTPEGDVNRRWDWTLYGVYAQDEFQLSRDVTVNAGLRYEGATLPVDPRDIGMPDLLGAPVPGPLYDNPGAALSPRAGLAWNVFGTGRTSVRAGYGLYFNTSNHQNLIVTVTNPPATPRVIIPNPTFPVPPFERGTGVSVRPVQQDIQLPRLHAWNANVQQELFADWVVTLGYAGSRGRHLWRNTDANIPSPQILPDGTPFYPAGLTRPNRAFSAIELKSSDGDSWYRALVVDLRKRWSGGLQVQSSYTWSKAEDTTQNATFFSDSTTAGVSAMPEFIEDYNKGLADFHAEHNWILNFVWDLPGTARGGVAGALVNGWRLSGLLRMRSGSPLTPMLQTNRSRSLWSPSLGPGTGPDRPSYAPGHGPDTAVTGDPARWFNPDAFVLPPAGTFGNVGRNELIGPDLRTVDAAVSRAFAAPALGARSRIDLRLEVFNVFNRANFGPPSLIAFAGTSDAEAPLASFGQIRSTVTSARQIQLGIRWTY
ncbi:MAG TPA: TonB-dependent receptor [Vicinamibacterales bacterium]